MYMLCLTRHSNTYLDCRAQQPNALHQVASCQEDYDNFLPTRLEAVSGSDSRVMFELL